MRSSSCPLRSCLPVQRCRAASRPDTLMNSGICWPVLNISGPAESILKLAILRKILRGQARLIYSSKWRGATVAWFADLCRACGAEQPAGQTRRRTRDSVLLICMLYGTYIQNVAANSPRTVSGTYSHAHVCAHCKSASYGHSSNMSCLRAAGLFAFLGIRYRN